MPAKPIELPPEVARLRQRHARFQAEPNAIKRDEIASRQLFALRQHYTGKLRIHDIKEMFEAMKAAVNEKAADNMLSGLPGLKIDQK